MSFLTKQAILTTYAYLHIVMEKHGMLEAAGLKANYGPTETADAQAKMIRDLNLSAVKKRDHAKKTRNANLFEEALQDLREAKARQALLDAQPFLWRSHIQMLAAPLRAQELKTSGNLLRKPASTKLVEKLNQAVAQLKVQPMQQKRGKRTFEEWKAPKLPMTKQAQQKTKQAQQKSVAPTTGGPVTPAKTPLMAKQNDIFCGPDFGGIVCLALGECDDAAGYVPMRFPEKNLKSVSPSVGFENAAEGKGKMAYLIPHGHYQSGDSEFWTKLRKSNNKTELTTENLEALLKYPQGEKIGDGRGYSLTDKKQGKSTPRKVFANFASKFLKVEGGSRQRATVCVSRFPAEKIAASFRADQGRVLNNWNNLFNVV